MRFFCDKKHSSSKYQTRKTGNIKKGVRMKCFIYFFEKKYFIFNSSLWKKSVHPFNSRRKVKEIYISETKLWVLVYVRLLKDLKLEIDKTARKLMAKWRFCSTYLQVALEPDGKMVLMHRAQTGPYYLSRHLLSVPFMLRKLVIDNRKSHKR